MPDQPRQPLANVDRLKEHMAAEGLAAVVARSGKNFSYLSALPFPEPSLDIWISPTPPVMSSASGPWTANPPS